MLLIRLFYINICSCFLRIFFFVFCRIFLDEGVFDNVLEVIVRVIIYYLDVFVECIRRIVCVEGVIKVLCNRLVVVDMVFKNSRDLVE